MVKPMKKILASWDHRHLNDDKLCRTLLQCHNMPSHKEGHSPAQKLFGYPIQDTLPAHLVTEWQKSIQEAEQQATKTLEQSTTYMPAHCLTYALALRWLYKVNRQNYGMYMGQLSPLDLIAGTMSRLTVDVFWFVTDTSYDTAYLHHFNPLLQYVILAHPINIPPTSNSYIPTSISRIYHPYTCDPTGHPQGLWKILTGYNFSIGAHFNTPMLGGRCRKLN